MNLWKILIDFSLSAANLVFISESVLDIYGSFCPGWGVRLTLVAHSSDWWGGKPYICHFFHILGAQNVASKNISTLLITQLALLTGGGAIPYICHFFYSSRFWELKAALLKTYQPSWSPNSRDIARKYANINLALNVCESQQMNLLRKGFLLLIPARSSTILRSKCKLWGGDGPPVSSPVKSKCWKKETGRSQSIDLEFTFV